MMMIIVFTGLLLDACPGRCKCHGCQDSPQSPEFNGTQYSDTHPHALPIYRHHHYLHHHHHLNSWSLSPKKTCRISTYVSLKTPSSGSNPVHIAPGCHQVGHCHPHVIELIIFYNHCHGHYRFSNQAWQQWTPTPPSADASLAIAFSGQTFSCNITRIAMK